MLYRIEHGKIRTKAVEIAAADHCNLRCAGCSHMSPFLQPRLLLEEEVARDLGRLSTVVLADEIRILGGEPLLNPRIVAILKAARATGIAKRVVLTTNGLLLQSMPQEFWENVDELRLNLYPGASPGQRLLEVARHRAAESGARLRVSRWRSFRVTMVTEPHPADGITEMIFRTCKNAHLYHCHMVHAGRLYKCSCPAYVGEFLTRIGQPGYRSERDGFDIHGGTDLRQKLWEFLTEAKPLDACRHCLGYAGHKQAHHQLSIEDARDPRTQPISRRTHLSKTILARETLRYFGRRATEAITGLRMW